MLIVMRFYGSTTENDMNKVYEQHNQEQQDYVDGLREINAELLAAAIAYQDMAICYRLGKIPSEGLFNRLSRAKATIAKARKS